MIFSRPQSRLQPWTAKLPSFRFFTSNPGWTQTCQFLELSSPATWPYLFTSPQTWRRLETLGDERAGVFIMAHSSTPCSGCALCFRFQIIFCSFICFTQFSFHLTTSLAVICKVMGLWGGAVHITQHIKTPLGGGNVSLVYHLLQAEISHRLLCFSFLPMNYVEVRFMAQGSVWNPDFQLSGSAWMDKLKFLFSTSLSCSPSCKLPLLAAQSTCHSAVMAPELSERLADSLSVRNFNL